MEAEAANQLPDSFDGVEIWAVWWKEEEMEIRPLLVTPLPMKNGVVIPGIISNDHDAATGAARDLPEFFIEAPGRLCVEPTLLLLREELSISKSYRTEIANGFAGRMVQQDRIFDFRRDPHATPRTMLLKMHFINSPEINLWVHGQSMEFFYKPPVAQDQPAQ